MRKLSPDGRADLRHLLCRAEPVEPGHQRGVQARRNRQRRGRNAAAAACVAALSLSCFQHRLCHFLHEQRNAVGALDDVLPEFAGRSLLPTTRSIMRPDFALRQPIDGQGGHIWPSDPRRLETPAETSQSAARGAVVFCPRCDQIVLGSSGRSSGRPQRSSDWILLRERSRPVKLARRAFFACALAVAVRARDNVRRSAATAYRQ